MAIAEDMSDADKIYAMRKDVTEKYLQGIQPAQLSDADKLLYIAMLRWAQRFDTAFEVMVMVADQLAHGFAIGREKHAFIMTRASMRPQQMPCWRHEKNLATRKMIYVAFSMKRCSQRRNLLKWEMPKGQ